MIEEIKKKFECFTDDKFNFLPEKHLYTYDNMDYISVTQYIQQFHKKFNESFWSHKKSKELGVSQQEVLDDWKKINEYANFVGQQTHQWIEDYFNQIWKPIPNNADIVHRINKFNKIYQRSLYKLTPIKSEQRIFSKKWRIAGTVDGIFLRGDKLIILDYKTNKVFTDDENLKYKERLLEPFEDYYKTHLNEYSIQISLYRIILREWGIDIQDGFLVYIGPDESEAKIYKCIDFTEKLENYLNNTRLF